MLLAGAALRDFTSVERVASGCQRCFDWGPTAAYKHDPGSPRSQPGRPQPELLLQVSCVRMFPPRPRTAGPRKSAFATRSAAGQPGLSKGGWGSTLAIGYGTCLREKPKAFIFPRLWTGSSGAERPATTRTLRWPVSHLDLMTGVQSSPVRL